MQILTNSFPIDKSTLSADYYILLSKEELRMFINDNALFMEELRDRTKDLLKRENHMNNSTPAF